MRVFVTGGTGLIGGRLVEALRQRGDEVVVLSRRPESAATVVGDCEIVPGNPTQPGVWQEAAAGCDAIVNLAGENVLGQRWSDEFKKTLLASREQGTRNCVSAILRHPRRADGSPKVLLNASAIGFYGFHSDEELDESSPGSTDFLARLCAEWEKAAAPAAEAGVRLVISRFGVVLDRSGGPLKKMLLPFKLGMGGPIASGRQFMSWVHHSDVTSSLLFALDHADARGPFNVTAPHPVTNRDFGKALGRALGRPAFVWTPAFAVKLLFGGGSEVIINGQRVLPRKLLEWGYKFRFADLDEALTDIMQSPSASGTAN